MSIANLTINEKISLLKELYHDIANKGQDGDTMLAHINPEEAALLKAHGGSGTINPNTGLPEYKGAIKKVAKIAVPVALGFAGAGALGYGPMKYAFGMGGYSPGGFFGSVSTAVSKFGGVSKVLQAGGLAMNVASNIQSQKYAGRQASAMREQTNQQNKAEEARNRYNQLLQKRSRLQSIRAARIQQGQIGASTAGTGLGSVGTSSYAGAVGAIGSQTSANLGNINVAQDVGNQISGYNIAAANAGSQANTMGARSGMFSNYASLGGTLLTEGKEIASIFGKA